MSIKIEIIHLNILTTNLNLGSSIDHKYTKSGIIELLITYDIYLFIYYSVVIFFHYLKNKNYNQTVDIAWPPLYG